MLRAALGAGVFLCAPRHAAAQAGDPRTRRPQPGDRLAFGGGERSGQLITPGDLLEGKPPVLVYPVDPTSRVVCDGSRLNQILLVRLAPDELDEETRARSADGIVAYSTRTFESHNWGPVLTTGGGLVFAGGTNDRYFRAFDGKTGEPMWQWRTNSGITGVPSSFAVDGVQYIAVQSGWGVEAQRMQGALDDIRGAKTDVPQGGVIWVFAVKR